MGRIVTIDLEKVLASGEKLKAKKPTESEVSKDPVAFLASLGVQLDEKTASMLKSKLAARAGGTQAGIVHIDIPT
jgi:hypothetical protein